MTYLTEGQIRQALWLISSGRVQPIGPGLYAVRGRTGFYVTAVRSVDPLDLDCKIAGTDDDCPWLVHHPDGICSHAFAVAVLQRMATQPKLAAVSSD